ncbi:hypothetical protein DPMN_158607 [Dreissena polymorpha]|uniref:Uncharacterized protein n=1 Tax=Dreissena polymorpha TaxID=45954 RepID=A0A9D4INC7_DREPO|nr:hypothetical protein DPMN_158607 [Dreissena polymorpha]
MDIVSNFHENQADNVTCRKAQNIIWTNIVTKIYEDRKINVTSRVKNAPPPGSHVFQPIVTILEMIQDIIETYSLAKFCEDWNIDMASTELTRQLLTAHEGHKAITKAHHEHSHKTALPNSGHVFKRTRSHNECAKHQTSRVCYPPPADSHVFNEQKSFPNTLLIYHQNTCSGYAS